MKRPTTSPTSSRLQAVFDTAPGGTQLVALIGSIDENADLQGLFAKLTGKTIMNLREVDRLNSMGVHRWIPLVTAFSARHDLVIDDISYAFVQNANVVANLFGSALVRSGMAPYYCGACKDNCSLPVTHEEVAATGYGAPVKQCPSCGTEMEFDELDGYFTFFKKRTRR